MSFVNGGAGWEGGPKTWRDDPITDAQKKALFNMYSALKWEYEEPKTKGEAADLINAAQKEINNRLNMTGKISPDNVFDDFPDEFADEDDGNDRYPSFDEVF